MPAPGHPDLAAFAGAGAQNAATECALFGHGPALEVTAMRISLDHAHIFASDVAATVRFFEAMFEATVIWDETVAGVRGIRLRIGGAFVMVYDQPPRSPRGGAFHHLGIATDDLAGLMRRMTAKGFVFRNTLRKAETFDYVMVAGPDELLIELFQCHEPARWDIQMGGRRAPKN